MTILAASSASLLAVPREFSTPWCVYLIGVVVEADLGRLGHNVRRELLLERDHGNGAGTAGGFLDQIVCATG